MVKTLNLGFPRLGFRRELKRVLERYWSGRDTLDELHHVSQIIRRTNWELQQAVGISSIPSNDFSWYDHVLDMSCLVGNVPPRFAPETLISAETYFFAARGVRSGDSPSSSGGRAAEMTKWFNTNYHYIVPELTEDTSFYVGSSKPFDEFEEAKALGISTRPVLIGPISYLHLGKTSPQFRDFDRYHLLPELLDTYKAILLRFKDLGCELVQMDEPVLSLDMTERQHSHFRNTYEFLSSHVPEVGLLLASYFGPLRENLDALLSVPAKGVHIDAVSDREEARQIVERFPKNAFLSLGIINGRNVWRTAYSTILEMLIEARDNLEDRLYISPSCSLIHVPATLRFELLEEPFSQWLCFAEEKLKELVELSEILNSDNPWEAEAFLSNKSLLNGRCNSSFNTNMMVRERHSLIDASYFTRRSTLDKRREIQRSTLQLPLFPTTTIGSFPQTPHLRAVRRQFKKGEITQEEYEEALELEIRKAVNFQEEVGLDLLVHGEFERSDMVEYFGEKLEGVLITRGGWVQSYGSRSVKPPIIYGDVCRTEPLTVRWCSFAQGLTDRPVKGMLTGPVTMVQWSFVREDLSRREVVEQIALVLRDEIHDLEEAGLKAIQVDEPALREGLPLRKAEWEEYLEWAVNVFRLATAGALDETQIHTHMCYSQLGDIVDALSHLDADVLSLETARSHLALLEVLSQSNLSPQIGPGVYDVHSPRIPTVEELCEAVRYCLKVVRGERLWINPDCGLKTRRWAEVVPALARMVEAAKSLRDQGLEREQGIA